MTACQRLLGLPAIVGATGIDMQASHSSPCAMRRRLVPLCARTLTSSKESGFGLQTSSTRSFSRERVGGRTPWYISVMRREPSTDVDSDVGDHSEGHFSPEQAKLVLDSWDTLRKDLGLHGLRFFSNILEIAPEVRGLFSFLKDYSGKLEDSPRIRQHARDIFRLTGETAAELAATGEVTKLEPGLIALGERHFAYHTKPEHFAVLKTALLRTLEQGYGSELSPELKAAWGTAYDALAKVVNEGLAKAARGQGTGTDFAPYTIRK